VETRANIAALQARLGTTTIYVTHDQVEAMTMGHRVAVLRDGILQQVDTPRALYDRPENAFVAGFIGSPAMNLKTVPLVDGGVKLGGLVVPLRRDVAAAAAAAGLSQIVFGIRPEAFTVATDGQQGLDLRVDIAEELGADAYVYGTATMDSGEEQFVVRVDGKHVPQMGQTIPLAFAEGNEHAFHPETGERLGD
jgi:multiple sugar transport system ATP-binding protein